MVNFAWDCSKDKTWIFILEYIYINTQCVLNVFKCIPLFVYYHRVVNVIEPNYFSHAWTRTRAMHFIFFSAWTWLYYFVSNVLSKLLLRDVLQDKNQSSGRSVRSESLKLWRIRLNQYMYCYISLIHNWPDYFKLNQNTAISKHFTQPTGYTRTSSGTIFRANVWISGGQVIFQYKHGAYR